jgi:hypothetical protein
MRHCHLRIMRMTSKPLIVADAVGTALALDGTVALADQRFSIEGTLIDHRGRRLIKIDKARKIFAIF